MNMIVEPMSVSTSMRSIIKCRCRLVIRIGGA